MMIMGHRGAAALEPENTLLSVSRAMDIGVDAVEIDVHQTRDQEIVVIHDDTVDRTTNGSGRVRDLTLKELKELDAGKGESIPTLQEMIDAVNGRVKLVIELKEPGGERAVVDLIERNHLVESAHTISFWHDAVKTVKDLNDRIKTGVLLVGCPVDPAVAIHARADALVMHYGFIKQALIQAAHGEGLKVFIWNIDDTSLVGPFAEMGVDGIGSNDPRVVVEYFKRKRP